MLPLLTASLGQVDEDHVDVDDMVGTDKETELYNHLYEVLSDCSRQRLRALQMSLRKFSNIEARISSKELQQVFQVDYLRVEPNKVTLRYKSWF